MRQTNFHRTAFRDEGGKGVSKMKKLSIAPIATLAITLITAALLPPFVHAQKSTETLIARSSSKPISQDADGFGKPPHNIAFQSNRDGNNEIYVMNCLLYTSPS